MHAMVYGITTSTSQEVQQEHTLPPRTCTQAADFVLELVYKKTHLGWGAALVRGILCNWLVNVRFSCFTLAYNTTTAAAQQQQQHIPMRTTDGSVSSSNGTRFNRQVCRHLSPHFHIYDARI